MTDADEERFLHCVEFTDYCWLWSGTTDTYGYGRFFARGRMHQAHRAAWELYCSEIPEGLCVLHSCDNPPCVNPAHLFLGTKLDNKRDEMKKGRNVVGEQVGTSKLTAQQVKAILEDTRPQIEIAREYGLCKGNVSMIKSRQTWRHLGP